MIGARAERAEFEGISPIEARLDGVSKQVVQGLVFEASIKVAQSSSIYQKRIVLNPSEYGYGQGELGKKVALRLDGSRDMLKIVIEGYDEYKLRADLVSHRGTPALKFVLKTRGNLGQRAPFLYARDFIGLAFDYFEALGSRVEKVLTHWEEPSSGNGSNEISTNYLLYVKSLPLLVDQSARLRAARSTWTGKVLESHGLTQVSDLIDFQNPTSDGVKRTISAVFSKPGH